MRQNGKLISNPVVTYIYITFNFSISSSNIRYSTWLSKSLIVEVFTLPSWIAKSLDINGSLNFPYRGHLHV